MSTHTLTKLQGERKNRASNLSPITRPHNNDQHVSKSIRPNIKLLTIEDMQKHLGDLFPRRKISPPGEPPERRGGYIGKRWTPGCGGYKAQPLDWLDFIWWEIGQSGGLSRFYNVQLCIRDESPAIPFDYAEERVTVRLVNPLTEAPMEAHSFNVLETHIARPGDVFAIEYPEQRGVLDGEYSKVLVKLPPLEVPGQRFIALSADTPDRIHPSHVVSTTA